MAQPYDAKYMFIVIGLFPSISDDLYSIVLVFHSCTEHVLLTTVSVLLANEQIAKKNTEFRISESSVLAPIY